MVRPRIREYSESVGGSSKWASTIRCGGAAIVNFSGVHLLATEPDTLSGRRRRPCPALAPARIHPSPAMAARALESADRNLRHRCLRPSLPIRAGLATHAIESDFTSIQQRWFEMAQRRWHVTTAHNTPTLALLPFAGVFGKSWMSFGCAAPVIARAGYGRCGAPLNVRIKSHLRGVLQSSGLLTLSMAFLTFIGPSTF